jgi:hypothetical protein
MPIRSLARPALVLFALGLVFAASHACFGQVSTNLAEVQNLGQWESALQSDLIAEKFESLDSIADHLRAEKTRLPGGEWQLRVFYTALDAPQKTEQDSTEHIAHLEHWMSQRPTSVTARVALATALTRWAWVARGHGLANTVTPDGWRLFGERIKEAQVILEGSAKMSTMCPQWYSAMMTVGNAQGWDTAHMHQILEDGTKFEPGYYYLYQQYANYLLPKWHGRPSDASSFARSSADTVGGDSGDVLYFQIATILIKRGDDDFPVHEMDWPRIQRGYRALISQYGPDRRTLNELAFMAWKYQDAAVARQQFALIGENWGRAVWRDRNYFDRARDWAQAPTPGPLPGQVSGQGQPLN